MESSQPKTRTAPKDMPSQLPQTQSRVAQPQKPRDVLPTQRPVTDDAPPPPPPSKWKRALKLAGAALLLLLALAFAYVFLLLGEPEDMMEAQPAVQEDTIRVPMTAVDAQPDADMSTVAASFGKPMLMLYTDQAALQGVRLYDTAFEGSYARRAAFRYAFPDGAVLRVESYRPAASVAQLMDTRYTLRVDRLYSLAGMNAVRMESDGDICVLAQNDEAAYVILCPRTHADALDALLRQTALLRPSAEF